MTEPLATIDQAEEIVRGLFAAVRTRRIYAREHPRVRSAMGVFLKALRLHLAEQPVFRVAAVGGYLLHEGIPLSSAVAASRGLAAMLDRVEAGGLVFESAFKDRAAKAVLDWLARSGSDPMPENLEGIRILPVGAADREQPAGRAPGGLRAPEFEVPARIREASLGVMGHIMEDAQAGRSIDFKEVIELTKWAAEGVYAEGAGMFAATQQADHDRYTFGHSVNVFLIATTLLQPFARNREELARFSQAALLHDVGKSLVPPKILHKRTRLTLEEKRIVWRHPEFGAEVLSKVPEAGPLAVEVAFCHHMRDEGLGYPIPTLPIRPGPITNVIQVADMFEALTARRPYHQPLSAEEAVACILSTKGMQSKRAAMGLLLQRLTNSPPGSEVTLRTGERCLVIRSFPDRPDHPLVRVLADPDGSPVAEPFDIDLREAAAEEERPIREVHLKPSILRTGRESTRGAFVRNR